MAETKKNIAAVPTAEKLLLISFAEGASVMVAELAGGKMLAPFYGTSLYVWASTLAITLGALTIGYYWGGILSQKEISVRKNYLFWVLVAASALIILMPPWANFVMKQTLEFSFLSGLVISQLSFLFLPVMGMGMVSPFIISLLAENNTSGKSAGLVYAISTLGGVIATLLTGFWLVPLIGISIPCMIIGSVLFLLTVLFLRPGKPVAALLLVLFLMPSVFFYKNAFAPPTDRFSIVYQNEGMLGQIKIIDFKSSAHNHNMTTRTLLVNHNWQTWIDKDNPAYSFLFYTRFTHAVINSLPKGSHALLIGLGGGTVAKQFEASGVDYDAVEIDGRLPEIAKKYFGLKGSGNLIVDDGRHYLNVCKRQYDLVIIDALLGENVPSHLLSYECFNSIKHILKPNGKIFIEFDGIEDNENGKAQKMLYHTLKKAGFTCQLFSSKPGDLNSDCMFLASEGSVTDFDTASINKDFYFAYEGKLKDFKASFSNEPEQLLSDNNPALDFYLRQRMINIREEMLKKQNMSFLEDDMIFYY
jgi:predicted membrane-bound spermidine synthase